MADKLHQQSQLEQLKSRHVGIGDADISRYEWQANIHRDTLSSIIGHPSSLELLALAEGECMQRTKLRMTEKMLMPIGPPPSKEKDL
ncbi:hypothetical protein NEOLI_003143 [Neolecta irregularis DAH-3]|uniref:Splicing factor subunit n=1 Tax=Neolecta irregularis (strain DAH-3) TaxID=1198029 RepID=A0A1U7LQZ8_NEOID|nr:hypothetical protein NEOLI_003143 [Neolecta irregularis DAH-3]|eukprot:OLL24941.1 hypothetical protein NEOLI_003143 [Neolecta irregularis DAH-3]